MPCNVRTRAGKAVAGRPSVPDVLCASGNVRAIARALGRTYATVEARPVRPENENHPSGRRPTQPVHIELLGLDVLEAVLWTVCARSRSPAASVLERASSARSVLRFLEACSAFWFAAEFANVKAHAVLCITCVTSPIRCPMSSGGNLLERWARVRLNVHLLRIAVETGVLRCAGSDCSMNRKWFRTTQRLFADALPGDNAVGGICANRRAEAVTCVSVDRTRAHVCATGRQQLLTVRADGVNDRTLCVKDVLGACSTPEIWNFVAASESPLRDATAIVLADCRDGPSPDHPVSPGGSHSFGKLVLLTTDAAVSRPQLIQLEQAVDSAMRTHVHSINPAATVLSSCILDAVMCFSRNQVVVVLEPEIVGVEEEMATILVVVNVSDCGAVCCRVCTVGGRVWTSVLGAPLVSCHSTSRTVAIMCGGKHLAVYTIDEDGLCTTREGRLPKAQLSELTALDVQFTPAEAPVLLVPLLYQPRGDGVDDAVPIHLTGQPCVLLYQLHLGDTEDPTPTWNLNVSLSLVHQVDHQNVVHASVSPSPDGVYAVLNVLRLFDPRAPPPAGCSRTIPSVPSRSEQWIVSLAHREDTTMLLQAGFRTVAVGSLCDTDGLPSGAAPTRSTISTPMPPDRFCAAGHRSLCRLKRLWEPFALQLSPTCKGCLHEFVVKLHWLTHGWVCEVSDGVVYLNSAQ